MHKFTTQDCIDMASKLYDEKDFTRKEIRIFLTCLRESGHWEATEETLERVYDMVVG